MLLKRTSVYLRIVTHFVNRIGGVMVCMLASSAVDIEFEPRSGKIKDYRIGILLLLC